MASPVFSDPGVALATLLHTLGAIGYMGGIAFYIGWARSLHKGHDNPAVLATGASLTYVSILANLLGGFVRTYLPGHPSLLAIGESAWVAVMAIKHVALFAGIAAAAYLFEVHAPRLRRQASGTAVAPRKQREARAMLATVVGSIIVAAVLGGVSTVLDVGAEAEADGAGIVLPERPDPVQFQRGGTVTSGASELGTFEVPEGATRIEAVFSSPPPQGVVLPYQFTVELRDPTGATIAGDTTSQAPTEARRVEVIVAAPAAGTWQYAITTDAGVAADYTLDVTIVRALVIEETVTILAGATFEINTRAEQGAVIGWEWEADRHLEWNVHTHTDGFQAVVEEHADTAQGRYVVETAGPHSLFWKAEADTTLTFRVWGDFEVDSIVG